MADTLISRLPDRRWLLGTLDRRLDEAPRAEGLAALLVVKAEGIRDVNLEFGYRAGDALLDQVVQRVSDCLRASDVVARLGATELGVALTGLRSHSQPLMAVSKIQRSCEEPFDVGGTRLKPRLRFGVSLYPGDARDAEELLRCADVALVQARDQDVDSMLYSQCEGKATRPAIALERDLEAAVRSGGLDAHYQPIVDLRTGALVGVEQLSRWTSKAHGVVPPGVFIDTAERTGLITQLTLWSLNRALRESSGWQDSVPHTSVSVNLSALVLSDPHFPELVMRALKVWDTRLGQLTVEVTESAMMKAPETCHRVLGALQEYGVAIAIDDFGTGHSSLTYLRDLPVSVLKIDKSFVTHMTGRSADRRIVQAVIDLAANFDLSVVAEGVEDEETLEALKSMGCARAQGYHIARAMPASELAGWVRGSPWTIGDASGERAASYLEMSAPRA